MDNSRSLYVEHDPEIMHAIERFELVAKATHDVIWDWDLVKGTVWWNRGMEHNFGYKAEDIGRDLDSWTNRLHPDDRERVLTRIYEVIDHGGTNWADFYRFRKSDGSYAHVHDRGYTIQEDNKPVRMVGSMMDVTGQLRSERELQESRENLQFALHAAQIGVWNLDPINRKVTFDERCMELYGYPLPEQMIYDKIVMLIHADDQERIQQAVVNAMNPVLRAAYNVRFRVIGAQTKQLRWLQCQGMAYFDANNVPYRFAGVSRDITQSVVSQEKVLWADQRAAMTIEGSGAGSFLIDLKTEEIIYSPTMARILSGREDVAITRESFIQHVYPEDVLTRMEAYKVAAETGQLKYECRFVWDDGSVHWVRVIGQNLKDASGKDISLSGIVMDITDRIESEQRLRESEEKYRQLAMELEQRVKERTEELRLANKELMNSNNNLQQFAYAASHDMQEPLRKVLSFSSRLQNAYGKQFDETGAYMLNRIQDATKRMSGMIDDLLTYSRLTHDPEFAPVDMTAMVASILADLEISIQEKKAVIRTEPLPVVWGTSSQLTHLMQNLISNAIKYHQNGKPVQVSVRAEKASRDEISSQAQLLPNHSYVRIEVADNGIGFDEAHLDRIFRMFQRLHGRSEFAGSGIGLALCKRVVQNHFGHITARSKPGEGATFMVYLPEPL
ncbi:PAS domain-containing sensor histidine kinase [Dyadobacter sandarakinus]|uniref:histidine kinase n=1 Tax=Dyadobacter sandarakinus TaxID=2747268 RepID=A0ABX7I3Q9_9BACT|nr:PAS domain-containing protein [Dyadobacter sandarakinus]QRQ99675.1 PAS domain-containing protein [Dyadobacter sandarakinus]